MEKINALARQGYRLSLVNKQVAVMYRRRGPVTPVSYVWVNATNKDFETRLARLQEAGAVYRATYPQTPGGDPVNLRAGGGRRGSGT
jgi:hypothetical protein